MEQKVYVKTKKRKHSCKMNVFSISYLFVCFKYLMANIEYMYYTG